MQINKLLLLLLLLSTNQVMSSNHYWTDVRHTRTTSDKALWTNTAAPASSHFMSLQCNLNTTKTHAHNSC